MAGFDNRSVMPAPDSVVNDNFGLMANTNVGKSSNDMLAEILRANSARTGPSKKATIGALVAGALAGAVSEKAAPGSGAAAGLNVAGSVLGASADKAAQEKTATMKALLGQLETKQKLAEWYRTIGKDHPEMIANLPPETQAELMDIPVVPDFMAEARNKLADDKLKSQRALAEQLYKQVYSSGDPVATKEALKIWGNYSGHEITDDFANALAKSSLEEQNQALLQKFGLDALPAIDASRASGKSPMEFLDLIQQKVNMNPDHLAKAANLAQDKAAVASWAAYEQLLRWRQENPNKAKALGLSLTKNAEAAGIDPAVLSALPSTVLSAINADTKSDAAIEARKQRFQQFLMTYPGLSGLDKLEPDPAKRMTKVVEAFMQTEAVATMAGLSTQIDNLSAAAADQMNKGATENGGKGITKEEALRRARVELGMPEFVLPEELK